MQTRLDFGAGAVVAGGWENFLIGILQACGILERALSGGKGGRAMPTPTHTEAMKASSGANREENGEKAENKH